MDLEQIARNRRLSLTSVEDKDGGADEPWDDVVVDDELSEMSDEESHRISTLLRESEAEQKVLRIAACLGSLDIKLLQASTSSKINVSDALSSAMEKGIIVYANEEYTFGSEAMQLALYQSIPSDEKSRQHVSIGRRLVENLTKEELEKDFYTVLRQFRLGTTVINNQMERYSIAAMCLQAAELAVPNGDFHAASRYLDFGMELLGSESWENEYNLTLNIYNAAAEIEYSKSNFDKVDWIVDRVLTNSQEFHDTLRARAAHIYALTSRYKMKEAIEESLSIMDRLGGPLPTNPRKRDVVLAFWRTRRLLKSKTNEMILRMPLISDPNMCAMSQILNLMFSSTFRARPLLFALVVLKLVRVTMEFGLSAVSAVGFGHYGSILCAFSGSIEEGLRYGQLALSLLDKFNAKEWLPRTYLGVYGHIGTYKFPLQEMYPHLKQAQQIALQTGDTMFASTISNVLCAYIHHSGDSLSLMEETITAFFQCGAFQKQETSLLFNKTSLQLVHNLTRRSKDPLKLSGDIVNDEAEILLRAAEAQDNLTPGFLHFFSLTLAYVFNEYEIAAAKAHDMKHIFEPPYLHPSMSCPFTFHALALLAVCNNRPIWVQRKIYANARHTIKTLKRFSGYTSENCLGKVYLLQAEVAAATSKLDAARCMYMSATGVLAEVGDKMMHAIACERAAQFFQARGIELAATRYARKAHVGYAEWGATAKVLDLEKKMPWLADNEIP